ELGSVWNRLGSEVTALEFLPRIAIGFDLELSNLLQRLLTAQGITFHLETKVSAVKVDNGHATVTAVKNGEELKFEADKVLVSVGRRPFSDALGAEKVGVAFDERKRIKVDKHFRTNVEGIYAIGDIIAGPMLAHKAEDEGIACVEIIAGKAGHVNYEAVASIIYTNPELAGVDDTGNSFVVYVAGFAGDDFYAGDSFVLGFVRQHRPSYYIADRVNPFHVRAKMFVHFDPLLFVELHA